MFKMPIIQILHREVGMTTIYKISDLIGYRAVWFYEDVIANILSLNNFKKKH